MSTTIPARLDSSPVRMPASPPRLKRSASVASSLPTPPPTRRKRKRQTRSLHSGDEDGGLSSVAEDSDDDDAAANVNERLSKEAEEEEAFWRSQSQSQAQADNGKGSESTATEPEPEPALLYRKLQQTSSETYILPVSPPPSHRKPRVARPPSAAPKKKTKARQTATATVSPPSTPPAKRRKLELPRDEEHNPFLASPLGDDHQLEVAAADTPSAPVEKPTMTFVFRGVKRTFPNPYYEDKDADAKSAKAALAPEHPDFEPDERSVRKLLFKVKKHASSTQHKSGSPNRRAVDVALGKSAKAAPKAAAIKARVKAAAKEA